MEIKIDSSNPLFWPITVWPWLLEKFLGIDWTGLDWHAAALPFFILSCYLVVVAVFLGLIMWSWNSLYLFAATWLLVASAVKCYRIM